MKRKTFRVLLVSILTTVFMSSTVFANTASAPYETPTINSYKYTFTSEVWERNMPDGQTVEAVAYVAAWNESGSQMQNVPAGYMGNQARLYTSTGTLWNSSIMTYNTKSIAAFIVYSPRTKHEGTYYAQSKARFYNGNGYNDYTGYKSPNYMFKPSTRTINSNEDIMDIMTLTEYPTNVNGETYGSALSEHTIGVEPDLIFAIGTNGVEGYVRATDLTPAALSTEEAIEYMNEHSGSRTIPLYDVNGTTVLGEFVLEVNYSVDLVAK